MARGGHYPIDDVCSGLPGEAAAAEWNRVVDEDPESVGEVYAALTVKKTRPPKRQGGRGTSFSASLNSTLSMVAIRSDA